MLRLQLLAIRLFGAAIPVHSIHTAGQLFFLLRDAGVSLDADLPFGGRATLQAPNMLEAGFELLDEDEENAWEAHCQKASFFDL
jgi:hypothetical protein